MRPANPSESDTQAPVNAGEAVVRDIDFAMLDLFPALDVGQWSVILPHQRLTKYLPQYPVNPREVIRAVRASGAFPVAFPPADLHFETFEGGTWSGHDLPFIDGGAFNNNPLDLARQLDEHSGHSQADGAQRLPAGGAMGASQYLYVAQDLVPWEWYSPPTKELDESTLLDAYAPLLGDIPKTVTQSQLMSTIEQDASMRFRIDLPIRQMPLASEHLFAMSGFFDQDFRRYDYYRGILDAEEFARTLPISGLYAKAKGSNGTLTDDIIHAPDDLKILDCFREAHSRQDVTGPKCSAIAAKEANLLRLLRVSEALREKVTVLELANKEAALGHSSSSFKPANLHWAQYYKIPRWDLCRIDPDVLKDKSGKVRSEKDIVGTPCKGTWFGAADSECRQTRAVGNNGRCAPVVDQDSWFDSFAEAIERDAAINGGHYRLTQLGGSEADLKTVMREHAGGAVYQLAGQQHGFLESLLVRDLADVGLNLAIKYDSRPWFATVGLVAGGVVNTWGIYRLRLGDLDFRPRMAFYLLPFETQTTEDPNHPYANRSDFGVQPQLSLSIPPLFLDKAWWSALSFEVYGGLLVRGGRTPNPWSGNCWWGMAPEVGASALLLSHIGITLRYTMDQVGEKWPSHAYAPKSTLTWGPAPWGSLSAGVEWRFWL